MLGTMDHKDHLCHLCLERRKGTGCSGSHCDSLGRGGIPWPRLSFLISHVSVVSRGPSLPPQWGVTAPPCNFGLDPSNTGCRPARHRDGLPERSRLRLCGEIRESLHCAKEEECQVFCAFLGLDDFVRALSAAHPRRISGSWFG